jgi:Condensation domain
LNEKQNDALAGLGPQEKRDLLRRMLEKKAQQERDFPLSQHQRGMWFLDQMTPGIISYNTALAVRATPVLNTTALSRAIEKLSQRHAALRTIFLARDGVPLQRVCDRAAAPVRIVNMAGASDESVRQAVIDDYRLPFDLETSPLRVTLFRQEDSDVLLLTVHHIVFDAWSAGVLYRELTALYDAELRGGAAGLDLIPAAYRDFVDWQLKMLESEEGEDHWQYWSGRLSGSLPTLDLPFRKDLTQTPSFSGGTVPLHIGGPGYTRLKELVRERQITVFSAVAAAYSALLHRLSGQDELLIGTAVSGRTQPQWGNVIGDFINMLPLRLAFPAELDAGQHLQAVSVEIRNSLAHQDFPFPLMVERLRVRREPGRSPLFQAMVGVHVARAGSELSRLFDDHAMPFGDSLLRNYPIPQQEGQYDLALELLDTGEALLGGLGYNEEAFDAEAAGYMATQFASLLEQIAAQPRSRINEYHIDPRPDSAANEHFVI